MISKRNTKIKKSEHAKNNFRVDAEIDGQDQPVQLSRLISAICCLNLPSTYYLASQ